MSSIELEVARSADDCYRLLCDVRRIPEWVPGVAEVRVIALDPAGRPKRVEFTSMPARGSLSYTLEYDFDDSARALRWHTDHPKLRDVRGEAVVRDVGANRCLLRYDVSQEAAEELPSWARAALAEDTAQMVVRAFCRWAEDR